MKHLINIENLSIDEINQIYIRANEFEKGVRKSNHINAHVVTMFFENSTRTKMSFEMAINKLNANKYETKEDYEFSKIFNTVGEVDAKRSNQWDLERVVLDKQ